MVNKRRVLMVGGTFFLAAATGHLMQSGESVSSRLRMTSEKVVTLAAPLTEVVLTAGAVGGPVKLPDLPVTKPQPLTTGNILPVRAQPVESAYQRPETDADAQYSVFGIACTSGTLRLETAARATLKIALSAPCYPNEKVTITHAGMSFAQRTDDAGDLDVILPALSRRGAVSVGFTDGKSLSATTAVTGLESLTRIALQWQGGPALQLHAYENGSTFGGVGHVSAEAPRDRMTSDGGFLTVLGDPELDDPILAEVYSAPAGTVVNDIQVEASVTETSCARDLSGVTLRTAPAAEPAVAAVSFAMPGCEAIGQYAVMSLAPLMADPVAIALGGQ